MPAPLTGPADLRDSRWLDEQTAIVTAGIETVQAVREAAMAIWTNWTAGRNVGRFHPKQTAGEYIESIVGHVRLPKPERNELIAALSSSGMSTREVAQVVGVSRETARRLAPDTNVSPDPLTEPTPTRITGADGKSYPAMRPAPASRRTAPVVVIAPVRPVAIKNVVAQLERDLKVLVERYRSSATDARFPARYADLLSAIDSALAEEE